MILKITKPVTDKEVELSQNGSVIASAKIPIVANPASNIYPMFIPLDYHYTVHYKDGTKWYFSQPYIYKKASVTDRWIKVKNIAGTTDYQSSSIAKHGLTIVSVGYESLIVSKDGGKTWQNAMPKDDPTNPDWQMRSYTDNSSSKVIWAGNQFIMITYNRIWRSTDGLKWQPAKINTNGQILGKLYDVNWNGGQLLAVGEHGTVLISHDGKAWHMVNADYTQTLSAVAWNGKRYVVISKQHALTSVDGIHWVLSGAFFPEDVGKIVWNGQFFLVTGQEKFYTSKDADRWQAYDAKTTQGYHFVAGGHFLIWKGDRFFASRGGQTIYSSKDAHVWKLEFNAGS